MSPQVNNRINKLFGEDNAKNLTITSGTTRRDGIVANIDVGVDILNEFGLKNDDIVGRVYRLIQNYYNIKFLKDKI